MVQFKVLGPLIVERDAAAIALNAQMLRRLLATLLVNANRHVTVDELVAALWGDSAPPGSRKTLQVYLHRLRQALGEPDLILQDASGYRLTVAPDRIDAMKFEHLADEGRKLRKRHMSREAADAFTQALALWRGQAYADVSDHPPMLEEAQRLDEQRLRVASELIETRLSLGHHEDLVPELVSLIAHHPYREDIRGHLMLALYRSGRQAEALNLFHSTRNLLREELGLEPGAALRKLQESILRSDPELDLVAPAEKPAIIPRELPASTAGFTGRTATLATLDRIREDASPAAVPIALISGAGGVGKTALALRWAHQAAGHFPDGQLFVDLRGYSTTAQVRPIEALTAFLRSLGLPPRRIPIETGQAAALYRSQLAGRRMLVLLDNARSIDDVRPLLPGTPGCMVVVTSRDRLAGLVAREGATRVSLDVLSHDDACALITGLHREANADPSAVAALARICAHLPLAIRIAVAQLLDRPDMTITDLIARLNEGSRLGALAVPGDDTMAIRKTFDLSYRSVPPEAQLLFRRLGIMPCHDFTPESAGALAGLPRKRAGELLELLADVHLLHRVREGRYAVHDLLHDYARERADAEDSAEASVDAARRFFAHNLARTKAAAQLLYRNTSHLPSPADADEPPAAFANEQEALTWLDDEYINIVASARHPESAGDLSVAWRIADQLRGYFDLRRHMAHWLAAGRAGLSAARRANDDRAQAAMFQSLGHAYGSAGKWQASLRNLERAASFSKRSGWKEGLATAASNIGVVNGLTGKPAAAVPMFVQAMRLWHELGDVPPGVKHLHNLATCHWQMGNLEQALQYSTEAVHIGSTMSTPYLAARSSFGKALCMLGRYEAGLDALKQCASALQTSGNRPFEAYTLIHIGEAFLDLGDHDSAQSPIAEGLRIGREISLPDAVVAGLTSLAMVLQAMGDDEGAESALDEAIELAERTMTYFELARAVATLARSQVLRHRYEAAAITAKRGVALCLDGHFRLVHAEILLVSAAIAHAENEAAQAVSLAVEALEIFQESGCRAGAAEANTVLAALVPDRGATADHARAARRIYEETGAKPRRALVVSDSSA